MTHYPQLTTFLVMDVPRDYEDIENDPYGSSVPGLVTITLGKESRQEDRSSEVPIVLLRELLCLDDVFFPKRSEL